MALIHVHKAMIGTALVFSILFSIRGFVVDQPLVGSAFAVFSAGLSAYAVWFWTRKAAIMSDAARTDDSD
jgi:hypothetical protein